jgi:hypothetical protein
VPGAFAGQLVAAEVQCSDHHWSWRQCGRRIAVGAELGFFVRCRRRFEEEKLRPEQAHTFGSGFLHRRGVSRIVDVSSQD